MTKFDQKNQLVTGDQYNAENINIGISIDEYQKGLEIKELEIRKLLVRYENSEKERDTYKNALKRNESKLFDIEVSYKAYVIDTQKQIARLDKLKGQHLVDVISKIKKSLSTGDTDKAGELLTQIENQTEPYIEAAAEAAYQRGKLSEKSIRYKEALQHYQRSNQLVPNNTDYLNEIGLMCEILGQDDDAIKYYTEALNIALQDHGLDHQNVATFRGNIGGIYDKLGNFDKAIECYELAFKSDLIRYGDDNPKVAIHMNNIGVAYFHDGSFDKALDFYNQALEIHIKHNGENHPSVAIDWGNIGTVLNVTGDIEAAIKFFKKALDSNLITYSENHPNVATDRYNIGCAYISKKKYIEGIKILEQSLASDQIAFGSDHLNVARDKNSIGVAFHHLRNYKKAIRYYSDALMIFKKYFGLNHQVTQTLQNDLSKAKSELGC